MIRNRTKEHNKEATNYLHTSTHAAQGKGNAGLGLSQTPRRACRAREQSPGSRKCRLASGGCNFDKTRPWLGLVCLSKTPSGTFFSACPPWLGNGWQK